MSYTANTQRKFGEANHYHVAYTVNENGQIVPLLLTDAALRDARARAKIQPEDVPKLPWWREFLLELAL